MAALFQILKQGYASFLSFPFFIQLAVVTIFLCIFLVVTTLLFILIKRVRDAARHRRARKAQHIVTSELTQNVMLEDRLPQQRFTRTLQRLRKIARSGKLYRQVIADELIFYHRNLTDATAQVMYLLFRRLRLVENALRKIERHSWTTKAKGLREIQEMPPAAADLSVVTPLLNSTNNDLRIEAQAAYLKLAKGDPFSFLDNAKYDLLDWHQIILMDIITNDPNLKIPQFSRWLSSANPTIITFAIKLILEYQQFEAIPHLTKLFGHENEKVRLDAIDAAGKLYAEEAEPALVAEYQRGSVKLKKKAAEALGLIGSGKYTYFLENEFTQAEDFALAKTIGCALINQPQFNTIHFLQARPQLTNQQQLIFEHCSQLERN